MSSREESSPKWVDPCRMGSMNGASEHRMPDHKLLDNIVNTARIAQGRADNFKTDYVESTFNKDFQQHHNLYKEQDYDWLPTKNIPKELGQKVPRDHLESLELQDTLLKVYEYLQQIAVGLEQVVWDEEDRDGMFKSSFAQTEDYLRSLLCEVQTAIVEKDLTIQKNVSRDIMDKEFRNMDNKTNVEIRNWIIFRDYLNMLEYVIEVFEYFKTNLPTLG